MRRFITTLLVSAALVGSPAAFAQDGGRHRGDRDGGQGQGEGGGQGGNWKGNDNANDHRGRDRDRQSGNWQGNNRWQNDKNWNHSKNWNGGDSNKKWSNNWRSDRRFNWQNLRSRDRNRFRAGRYVGPRGYSYRRFHPGLRLQSFFFASQYWFDADNFGLPPAYGPYRWVRYYNDALLVNIYTGEVEDVIPNFFW